MFAISDIIARKITKILVIYQRQSEIVGSFNQFWRFSKNFDKISVNGRFYDVAYKQTPQYNNSKALIKFKIRN